MKIAITTQRENFESIVEPRFGRCNWFIVADTETGKYIAINNEKNLRAVQGAGIQTAENVSRHGVEAVITGHCGPKAFKVLNSIGIKIFSVTEGTVGEVLEKFKRGVLTEVQDADVEGHWI